jgi:hypothetical protein
MSLAKIAKTAKKNQRFKFEDLQVRKSEFWPLAIFASLREFFFSEFLNLRQWHGAGDVRDRMSLAKSAKTAKKNQSFNFEWLYLGDLGDLGESYFFTEFLNLRQWHGAGT